MDTHARLRELGFAVVLPALGFDIRKYKLRKNGQEYYGPCPVHAPEKNITSFSYLSDGRWNCFSCSKHGKGMLDLVMVVKQIGFKEAVAFLEPLVSSKPTGEPSKEKSPVLSDSVALQPFKGTYEKYAVPCPWLEERIRDEAIKKRYGVFCYNNPARKSAYSGRVMIPIRDVQGVLYGYLGRKIDNPTDEAPKYLFPPNLPKSRFLFGAHELGTFGQLPLRVVYLVESPFCVMKFAMYGLPALSPFGWSVSEHQANILASLAKGLIILPDRDKYDESHKTLATLAPLLWVRLPALPEGCNDPEAMTKEQVLSL